MEKLSPGRTGDDSFTLEEDSDFSKNRTTLPLILSHTLCEVDRHHHASIRHLIRLTKNASDTEGSSSGSES